MSESKKKISFSMFLVTIGVVYGDIGTSPMYVLKSILQENGGVSSINEFFIIGSLSLIIWTITLLTTIKYVLIALKADNHGEGGVFSLYSLVKNCGKWLIVPTMLGGASLLADGVLTPAVTVTTAVEGLCSIEYFEHLIQGSQTRIIIITLLIISALFLVQRAGTSKIGRAFGPVMLIWFSFLGITGAVLAMHHPVVFKAFNPLYAVRILNAPVNKSGFMILGSIFLAATGAEALYSDMGQVGRGNIYVSWPFVKCCLILNYLGQGAWILQNAANTALFQVPDFNPFFQMLPENFRPFAVLLGAMAAVIASQALITGSFSLVAEAIKLDLMPHLQITYPADTKHQLYIPTVNNILWIGCSLVVLYFRTSSRMEAAYGLAITVTMLMTTLLLSVYERKIRKKQVLSVLLLVVFGTIESVFFISSLGKFTKGGYVAVFMALVILCIEFIWYRGTEIEKSQSILLKLRDYVPKLRALKDDDSIPMKTDNLVFLTKGHDFESIDRDVLYSILDKDSKRARVYWFISVHALSQPYGGYYTVESYGTDFVFKVQIYLGFKVNQRVNVYLRQIVGDLLASGELMPQTHIHTIYEPSPVGNFKFCLIRKLMPEESELSTLDTTVIRLKYAIRRVAGNRVRWYGLETSSVIIEYVPLFVKRRAETFKLERREN